MSRWGTDSCGSNLKIIKIRLNPNHKDVTEEFKTLFGIGDLRLNFIHSIQNFYRHDPVFLIFLISPPPFTTHHLGASAN